MSGSALVASIGWTLIHFVWQGVLIGCATALALIALRNARPEHRYTLACSALLLCLAWPALDLYLRLAGSGASGASLDSAGFALTRAATNGHSALVYLQDRLAWVVGLWALCRACRYICSRHCWRTRWRTSSASTTWSILART